eukprot:gb/GECG01012512.1/.p1 GENE.gb/GECG01012512.1/~~gb/GECG01012512.1/.p1  ORF type:complete len:177 (+),score=12.72 gb/GECG01012512.1/:1-531(+)
MDREKFVGTLTSHVDGFSAEEIFFDKAARSGFTYDDIIFLPGCIDFGVSEIDLTSRLTRNISLNTPVVSSPMDTVTEANMAISMALQGGIGIIHYNWSIQNQVDAVQHVKRFRNGFITSPVCFRPDQTVKELDEVSEQMGFSSFPITQDGKMGSKLLGTSTTMPLRFSICTRDDSL